MNKIVLLNGNTWTTRANLMHVAIMWECLRNGTLRIAVIIAFDEKGRQWDLDLRKVDPAQSFDELVYDRASFHGDSTPPRAA